MIQWGISKELELPDQFIQYIENQNNTDKKDSEITHNHISVSESLDGLKSWQKFKKTAEDAIKAYPLWKKQQTKVQKTGNLKNWLIDEFGINEREADIIKKFLSEKYKNNK